MSNLGFDSWWQCPATTSISDPSVALTLAFFTFFGVIFGTAITAFVQSVVLLHTREQLIVTAHLVGGFVWYISLNSCQKWGFPLLVAQTYLYGAEPYDNLFSAQMWTVCLRMWRKFGEKIHVYWAVSSLVVHTWFVAGAATLSLGITKPSWILFAILGFFCSHVARVFSYHHYDRVASALESMGVGFLIACLVIESLDPNAVRVVWLSPALLERLTHLPAAFRGDASWMRSYELWAELQRRSRELADCDIESPQQPPCAADQDDVETVLTVCPNCQTSSRSSLVTADRDLKSSMVV